MPKQAAGQEGRKERENRRNGNEAKWQTEGKTQTKLQSPLDGPGALVLLVVTTPTGKDNQRPTR